MPVKRAAPDRPAATPEAIASILAELAKRATKKDRENLARFGIDAPNALGVSMANLQKIARSLGKSHELAEALWRTGQYEARLLTAFVDEPDRVTPRQMDAWARDFDNWAIVDTLCFHSFDRSSAAFSRVKSWSTRAGEFEKRAAFALLASLALHARGEGDAEYFEALPLVEKAAKDPRNFVKKGVSWALRSVGRRSAPLHEACVALARRLVAANEGASAWVGRDALRDLTSAAVLSRIAAKKKARAPAKKTIAKKAPLKKPVAKKASAKKASPKKVVPDERGKKTSARRSGAR